MIENQPEFSHVAETQTGTGASKAEIISACEELSTVAKAEIDKWINKFPIEHKKSALIHALLFVQEENAGWLSVALMNAIAKYLELAKIEVYEVATFYSMFELKPVGKHKISVCTNISCMLRGCGATTEHLKKKLGINFGQTTKDGKFTLKEVECLAACGGAPVMQIGHNYHEHLTPEKIDNILSELE